MYNLSLNPDETAPRVALSDVVSRIESAFDDARRNLDDIEHQIDQLRADYPQVPRVMGPLECRGRRWYTDGYAVIRDVWPCEFEHNRATPDIGRLFADFDAVTANVVETHTLDRESIFPVVRLSNGAWVNRARHEELTIGRGWTSHGLPLPEGGPEHEQPKHAVVYRDRDGLLAGCIMPVTVGAREAADAVPVA